MGIQHVVNLTSSRNTPPMTPEQFTALLPTLTTTNGNDVALLEKKFAKGFKELFSSAIEQYDFSGLGWNFDIQVLFYTIFKESAGAVKILDLSDN